MTLELLTQPDIYVSLLTPCPDDPKVETATTSEGKKASS